MSKKHTAAVEAPIWPVTEAEEVAAPVAAPEPEGEVITDFVVVSQIAEAAPDETGKMVPTGNTLYFNAVGQRIPR